MDKSKHNPDIHHRRSIRLPGYDYSSSGPYFVTLCTGPRKPLFDHPELRKILEEVWQILPQRFQGLQLDEFVIMPDHIHFIIWLDANISNGTKLGDVIKAYKSLTFNAWLEHIETHQLNEQAKFWQRNYMERIIRTDSDLIEKREYIRSNPIKLLSGQKPPYEKLAAY